MILCMSVVISSNQIQPQLSGCHTMTEPVSISCQGLPHVARGQPEQGGAAGRSAARGGGHAALDPRQSLAPLRQHARRRRGGQLPMGPSLQQAMDHIGEVQVSQRKIEGWARWWIATDCYIFS